MPKTILEHLQDLIGTVYAYDGKFLLWASPDNAVMQQTPYDLRDLLPRLKIKELTLGELIECLPDFTPSKRGKVAVNTPEE
jgi:hypothetical protein